MSIQKVQAGLIAALHTIPALLALPSAYENADFTPPSGAMWARYTLMPTSIAPDTLGDAGQDRFEGYMQLDLFAPENTGTRQMNELADTVRKQLYSGRRFAMEGQDVAIRKVEIGSRSRADVTSSVQMPIFVYFRAWITRPETGDGGSLLPETYTGDSPDYVVQFDNLLT